MVGPPVTSTATTPASYVQQIEGKYLYDHLYTSSQANTLMH